MSNHVVQAHADFLYAALCIGLILDSGENFLFVELFDLNNHIAQQKSPLPQPVCQMSAHTPDLTITLLNDMKYLLFQGKIHVE